MAKGAHPYLKLRGNAWRVEVEVPKPLRAAAGRARYIKSLGVVTLPEAEDRKHFYVAQFKTRIEQLRKGHSDPGQRMFAQAVEHRETLTSPDNTPEDRRACSELMGIVLDQASSIQRSQGDDAARLFYSIATGKAELISEHYPVWLAQYRGTEKTKALHTATLKGFLAWAGQHMSVQETTRRKAGAYVQHLIDAGKARKTIARHLSALSSFWRWMISRGIIDLEPRDNPWREHNMGDKPEPRKCLSTEAMLKLLNASYASSRYNVMFHDMVRLALLTGIRVNALCSLKRSDVEKRKDGYRLSIEFDKTPSGTRKVPLHTAGSTIMARLMKQKAEPLFPDLVPDKWGRPSGNFVKAFTRFRKLAGVGGDGEVFHTTRNTFLEFIEKAGVPESTAKLLVGHKRPSLTYGQYSSGQYVELRRYVQKLNYGRAIMDAIKRAPPNDANPSSIRQNQKLLG